MTPAQQRKLAEEIAADLFTSVLNGRAECLVLVNDAGKQLSLWSISSAAKAIEHVIRRNQPRRKVKK